MPVRAYCEHLSALGAHRARALSAEGTLSALYVYLGPIAEVAKSNRAQWDRFRTIAPDLRLWGWWRCGTDYERDVQEIRRIDRELAPAGWLLNIEKESEGRDLQALLNPLREIRKPLVCSLGGVARPWGASFDHCAIDRAGLVTEWQCYPETNEGPEPAIAVRDLAEPERVHLGARYLAKIGTQVVWGEILRYHERLGDVVYDSYAHPTLYPRAKARMDGGWPDYLVTDRTLRRGTEPVGRLLGLARYARIRVAILADGIVASRGITRSAEEWRAYARSGRLPGKRARPVSVYLAERASDEMLRSV